MKNLIIIVSLLICLSATAQTVYNFTPSVLSGDYARPGAGNERWNENSGSQIVSGYTAPLNYYRRFTIRDIMNDDGSFNWTKFDLKLHEAIEAHQRFSFGIMQQFPWGDGIFNSLSNFSGIDQRTGQNLNGNAAYPLSWHTAMQAESVKDWIGESGDWVPNFNSASYLSLYNAMFEGIDDHLQTGSYQPSWAAAPIPYKNVIQYIDIRGFGSWGEWHVYGTAPGNSYFNFPAGTYPTPATFKSIVDAAVNNLQDFRLCIITNALDAQRLGNIGVPAEVAAYIYQKTTNKGFIGFRMDHFGDHAGDNPLLDDSYDDYQLQKNPSSFAGFRLDTAFQNRYRLAPFYGEPPGGPTYSFGIVQGVFPRQVRKWRVTMVGNGNFGQGSTPTGQGADSVRQGYREAGYHLRIKASNVVASSTIQTNIKWQNYGLTPTYDNWTVEFSLRNGSGTIVWTGNSSFDPYLFLPDYGEVTKTDNFSPGLTAGTYGLYIRLKDPLDYMTPLPLQITGRDANGYYFLTNVTLTSGTSNRPPVANAGPNQSITLPDDDANLSGSLSSDPDGTLAAYLWSQVSGPSTATITTPTTATTAVDNMVAGIYIFNLRVTDNGGSTSNDQVQITVNPANIAPVANAGANQSITQPTSTATLNGSSSTDDVAVTSYLWSQTSGPSANIASPNTVSTGISGMTTAGTYGFRLLVSDFEGLTDADTVYITVLPGNQAPVANAGANQSIQLPGTTSAAVSASASTDDVGITSYAWTQVGGPISATIVSPSNVNTNITGMSTAGIYTFRVTVSDGSLTNFDDVQITALAAPNAAPVADAGNPQSFQLPGTTSGTLNGSGSSDDVSISTYAWSQVSGPITATIATPTTVSTNISGLTAPGIYFFRLTVTDGGGLTNSDQVQITVVAEPVIHELIKFNRKFKAF